MLSQCKWLELGTLNIKEERKDNGGLNEIRKRTGNGLRKKLAEEPTSQISYKAEWFL